MEIGKDNLPTILQIKEIMEKQEELLDLQGKIIKVLEANTRDINELYQYKDLFSNITKEEVVSKDSGEKNKYEEEKIKYYEDKSKYKKENNKYKCEFRNRKISLSTIDDSDVVVRIGDFAESVKRRGIPYGRNKIHSWLNNRGYTYREDDRNYPYMEYIDEGLFKVKEYVINRKGGAKIESTMYLTPKGVNYFMEELLNEFGKNNNVKEREYEFIEEI